MTTTITAGPRPAMISAEAATRLDTGFVRVFTGTQPG
jgi:hypothetical protein